MRECSSTCLLMIPDNLRCSRKFCTKKTSAAQTRRDCWLIMQVFERKSFKCAQAPMDCPPLRLIVPWMPTTQEATDGADRTPAADHSPDYAVPADQNGLAWTNPTIDARKPVDRRRARLPHKLPKHKSTLVGNRCQFLLRGHRPQAQCPRSTDYRLRVVVLAHLTLEVLWLSHSSHRRTMV